MIPSDLAGLALFLVLLAPGLAYVLRHERVRPARSHTAFRETLRVVFVSVVCLTVAGLFVALLRWLLPRQTPNFRGLVRDPDAFAREHHVQLIWWGFGFVLVATLMGYLAADPRLVQKVNSASKLRLVALVTGSPGARIGSTSAWFDVLTLYDGQDSGPVMVGAQMADGTYVYGRLRTFNVSADEDENREMVLSSPTVKMANGDKHPVGHFSIIAARNIVRLDVTHLAPSDQASVIPDQRPEVEPTEDEAAAP